MSDTVSFLLYIWSVQRGRGIEWVSVDIYWMLAVYANANERLTEDLNVDTRMVWDETVTAARWSSVSKALLAIRIFKFTSLFSQLCCHRVPTINYVWQSVDTIISALETTTDHQFRRASRPSESVWTNCDRISILLLAQGIVNLQYAGGPFLRLQRDWTGNLNTKLVWDEIGTRQRWSSHTVLEPYMLYRKLTHFEDAVISITDGMSCRGMVEVSA